MEKTSLINQKRKEVVEAIVLREEPVASMIMFLFFYLILAKN